MIPDSVNADDDMRRQGLDERAFEKGDHRRAASAASVGTCKEQREEERRWRARGSGRPLVLIWAENARS